jgi:hypothetical protein
MYRNPWFLLTTTLFALGACAGEPRDLAADSQAPAGTDPHASGWHVAPRVGVTLHPGDPVIVETGPHVVLWPENATPLRPPYVVRATLQKRAGRIHEGYGIFFGGERLEASETEQAYSYFLVRGDRSFLVRRREGSDLPILQPWTSHEAIRADRDGVGEPHRLEVEVGEQETVFRVNDVEVTRIPTAELRVVGTPGLRVAHDVVLEVRSWDASAAGDAP